MIEWFGETERQIVDAEPLTSDLDRLREQQRDHKVIVFIQYTLLLTRNNDYFSVVALSSSRVVCNKIIFELL